MSIERLETVINQHGRWADLRIYTDRIAAHAETDFSHALENAKALLETICKEICSSKGVDMGSSATIQALMKRAFKEMGYPPSDLVTQVSTSLSTIGQKMGELRNQISPTSHGKTLDDLKRRNDLVDDLTREFLIDTTVSVASLMIRSFEGASPRAKPKDVLLYTDCEDFNELLDETNAPFQIGVNSYPASEAFYSVDRTSYESEYRKFLEGEDE
ncbi:abortive infection family protein [Novosphingobium sp. SL115]|uniref:abortive infection family protein n=1 Tax=Novosphingobium sp. SL115 TaxID=2995150 RepID=UPI002276F430|nr:abortive infection family protein [Novosphingobium sp. SL115]MCY1670186.1 abortive infection family protein [Novosphingobium sp. SL115]